MNAGRFRFDSAFGFFATHDVFKRSRGGIAVAAEKILRAPFAQGAKEFSRCRAFALKRRERHFLREIFLHRAIFWREFSRDFPKGFPERDGGFGGSEFLLGSILKCFLR